MLPRVFNNRAARRLVMVLACAALFWSFCTGIMHGFDHTVGHSAYGRFTSALGAAITDLKGEAGGYVISGEVSRTLVNGGLTEDAAILAPLQTHFPENFADARLLNGAIDAALKAKFADPPEFQPIHGDDLGFVDFIKLAFVLFGDQVLSLYLLYFVISAISITIFLVAFRDRPGSLALLGIVTVGELLLFVSDLYNQSGHSVGSITEPRTLSILAVIPGLHILLVIGERLPPSWPNAVALAIQAALVVFICSVRSSALWIVAAVAVLTAYALLSALWRRQPASGLRSLWAGLVLALGFVVHGFAVSETLNPFYQRHGATTHHFLWPSILYSLQLNPEWRTEYLPVFGDAATGDGMPKAVVNKYLERHPPAHPEQIYMGDPPSLTYQAYESMARVAFIEFLEKDPKFVLGCFLYYKPAMLIRNLTEHVKTLWKPADPSLWAAVISLVVMGVYFGASPVTERHRLVWGAALLTMGFFAASLPNLATVAYSDVIGDPFLLTICAFAAWAVVLIAQVVRTVQPIRTRRRPPHPEGKAESRADVA